MRPGGRAIADDRWTTIDETGRRRTPGTGHVVVTVVLLVACFALAQVAPLAVGRTAMEAVAAAEHADGFRWATGAMVTSLVGSWAVFVMAGVIAIWRLFTAISVAVTGCVLEVVLLLSTMMMTGLVG